MRRFLLILSVLAVLATAVACSAGAGATDSAATPTASPTTIEATQSPIPPAATQPPAANEPKPTSTPVVITGSAPAATQPALADDGPASGPVLPPCCKPLVTPGATPPAPAGVNPSTIASPPALIARTEIVAAPIESLAVQPATATGYVLNVRAGLPSGCAKPASHNVSRSGNAISVSVLNSTTAGQVICTQIYGIYSLSIDLTGPFVSGQTYTVRVNDKSTSFTAQ